MDPGGNTHGLTIENNERSASGGRPHRGEVQGLVDGDLFVCLSSGVPCVDTAKRRNPSRRTSALNVACRR